MQHKPGTALIWRDISESLQV